MSEGLYNELSSSSRVHRRAYALDLMQGMATAQDGVSNARLYDLCNFVVATQLTDEQLAFPQAALAGEILLPIAAEIVKSIPRTGGFLRAIQRSPQALSAIDAGCGPTAVLSLALAAFHPRAEIIAYELNTQAARCAHSIIELMGMDDQITVCTENLLSASLPRVDLAVTETFNKGLAIEPGAKIAHRLAAVATRILPARAAIYAQAGRPLLEGLWQKAGVIDFATNGEHVEGSFVGRRSGKLEVCVRAEYLDADDVLIVGGYDDSITYPLSIGKLDIPQPGTQINFLYPTGHVATESVANLWIAD